MPRNKDIYERKNWVRPRPWSFKRRNKTHPCLRHKNKDPLGSKRAPEINTPNTASLDLEEFSGLRLLGDKGVCRWVFFFVMVVRLYRFVWVFVLFYVEVVSLGLFVVLLGSGARICLFRVWLSACSVFFVSFWFVFVDFNKRFPRTVSFALFARHQNLQA